MTTWSGFHSRMKDCSSLKLRAEIDILPLFPENLCDVLQSLVMLGNVIFMSDLHIAHCGSGWGVSDV